MYIRNYCRRLSSLVVLLLLTVLTYGQGSCGSPNGVMNSIASPPADYQELEDNGYCMNGINTTSTVTMCFTLVPSSTDISINMGYSASCTNTSFSSFTLYNSSCTQVSTGLSYTGLTIGANYTFCLNMRAWGGPVCNGFARVCPYFINTNLLPVELISIECLEINASDALIRWRTASETNNDYYTVLKSDNKNLKDTSFIILDIINIFEDSKTEKEYNIYDLNCYGITYYKVSQTDNNGRVHILDLVTCKCEQKEEEVILEVTNLLGQYVPVDYRGPRIEKIKLKDEIYYRIKNN